MQNEPTEFRDRLLNAQQTTPDLREGYQQELESIIHHRLRPRTRLLYGGGLLLGVALAIFGAWHLLHSHAPAADLRIAWTSYITVCSACGVIAVWLARAVWQGTFAWRSYYFVTESMFVAAGLIEVLALLQGTRAPSDPASTFWAVYVGVLLVACLGWSLSNRIDAARLDAREGMLRLESRLADIAERLPK